MYSNIIKTARKRANLTQLELAELIAKKGTKPRAGTISEYENGVKKPDGETLERIMKVLNLEIKN